MSVADTTRNTERTRRAILDATVRTLAERGTAVTLRDVAEAADVSKSGLLHHFANREVLLRAVAQDFLERFRAAVMSHVDLSENRSGKILRAYVRALCGDDEVAREFTTLGTVWSALEAVPGVAALIGDDNHRWRTDLARDGSDPTRIAVVRYAVEGLVLASAYDDHVRTHDMARAMPVLLGLTDEDVPLPERGDHR